MVKQLFIQKSLVRFLQSLIATVSSAGNEYCIVIVLDSEDLELHPRAMVYVRFDSLHALSRLVRELPPNTMYSFFVNPIRNEIPSPKEVCYSVSRLFYCRKLKERSELNGKRQVYRVARAGRLA